MSRSKSDPKPKLGITPGDPAGIGPDITLAAYRQVSDIADIIVFANMTLLPLLLVLWHAESGRRQSRRSNSSASA